MSDQFFVSIQDAGKTGLILGPFTTEIQCKKYAYLLPEDGGSSESITVKDAVCKIDPKVHFAAWGMLKIQDVKPEEKYAGFLNRVEPEKWDKVLA
jgi:hypothetical protein